MEMLNRYRTIQFISKKGKPYKVARLVGHNAASFDGPRLMALFKSMDLFLPADPRFRCTCQRALWHFDESGQKHPENFKLETLCKHFGIQLTGAHDALEDVRATVALSRVLRSSGIPGGSK